MRPDFIATVRATWAVAAPDAQRIGLAFYARLFELDPSLVHLFPADLSAQTTKLMQTLAVAVASLDRLDVLAPALEALGRRHVGYGVSDAHYDTVGRALLDALAATFGGAFTEHVRAAWAETYASLTGVMRRASNEHAAALREAALRDIAARDAAAWGGMLASA
ncbi:MAG: hemin receptor [Gemmatirosa sp.]|nr:hemin receptor [Gemmatirosa sp.]